MANDWHLYRHHSSSPDERTYPEEAKKYGRGFTRGVKDASNGKACRIIGGDLESQGYQVGFDIYQTYLDAVKELQREKGLDT